MNTTIICPHCKKPFEISDAIQHQIEDELLRAKAEQSKALRRKYDAAAESKLQESRTESRRQDTARGAAPDETGTRGSEIQTR